MPSNPEELLRSIERTREELALTVDTIAGRLDPKRAAKRGVSKVKSGVASVVGGARAKLGRGEGARPSQGRGVGAALGAASETAKSKLGPAAEAAKSKLGPAAEAARGVPKPVIGGGLAALLALAAVLAARRRR